MLSSTFSWTMPHYNSSLSPNNKVKIFAENFQRYFRHLNSYLVDKVRFLGYDDRTTILKKIKEEQIAKEYKLVWNFPSGCTFKNIIEIFVSPKELESYNIIQEKIEELDAYLVKKVKNFDATKYQARLDSFNKMMEQNVMNILGSFDN